MERLKLGRLPAIASYVCYSPGPMGDEFIVEHHNESVPTYFWYRWGLANETQRDANWLVGDFKFEDGSRHGEVSYGNAFDVKFDADTLPGVVKTGTDSTESASLTQSETRGRKSAHWWPDFAEELAAYIHDTGLPAGNGTDGQSDMIDAIFERIVEQGKPEPGRTQVQPVINAVLRRLRSAGK